MPKVTNSVRMSRLYPTAPLITSRESVGLAAVGLGFRCGPHSARRRSRLRFWGLYARRLAAVDCQARITGAFHMLIPPSAECRI